VFIAYYGWIGEDMGSFGVEMLLSLFC